MARIVVMPATGGGWAFVGGLQVLVVGGKGKDKEKRAMQKKKREGKGWPKARKMHEARKKKKEEVWQAMRVVEEAESKSRRQKAPFLGMGSRAWSYISAGLTRSVCLAAGSCVVQKGACILLFTIYNLLQSQEAGGRRYSFISGSRDFSGGVGAGRFVFARVGDGDGGFGGE